MLKQVPLKTPGVYITEPAAFPLSIVPVPTAIPVFIGYTEKADRPAPGNMTRVPVRLDSFKKYEAWFGKAPVQTAEVEVANDGAGAYTPISIKAPAPSNYRMYHALQLFFDNGGGPCYVISVGSYKADGSVSAEELGVNGTGTGGLDLAKKLGEATLLVIPDANGLAGPDDSVYYALFNEAVRQCHELQDRLALVDVKDRPIHLAVPNLRSSSWDEDGLKYAAAYYPWLKTTYKYRTTPDSLLLHFKEINGPATVVSLENAKNDARYGKFITNDFLSRLQLLLDGYHVLMPPSPAVAGIYSVVDNTQGVWSAPANVAVQSVTQPTVKVNNNEQDDLMVHLSGKSVNAIRSFPGRGTLVWGARTLAGNDADWRYVNVRRFFNMVEQSLKTGLAAFVFEPNDANTWLKIKAAAEGFLLGLWRQGALTGAKPEEAFGVEVGLGRTMAPTDVAEGRIIVEIRMAAIRPAEFTILTLTFQTMSAAT